MLELHRHKKVGKREERIAGCYTSTEEIVDAMQSALDSIAIVRSLIEGLDAEAFVDNRPVLDRCAINMQIVEQAGDAGYEAPAQRRHEGRVRGQERHRAPVRQRIVHGRDVLDEHQQRSGRPGIRMPPGHRGGDLAGCRVQREPQTCGIPSQMVRRS